VLDSLIFVYVWRHIRGCSCYIEFDDRDGYVWIEDAERGTLDLIYFVIIDSGNYDLEDVISRSVVAEIV